MKKMTKKQAIKILLDGALSYGRGVGLGISTGITSDKRKRIWEATHIIWPYLYGREMTEADEFNEHFSTY